MSTKVIEKPVKLLPNKEDSDEWKQFIPILYWLPKYDIHKALFEDVITGLTLGIMSIPQGMAYAVLAGVNPISGIYVTLFAPLCYAILGTSSQLHVSSIAITSIMSAEAVRHQLTNTEIFVPQDRQEYDHAFLSLTALIAFQVGVIQFILGILNAGVIANMLSHSVIIGFMGSASLIIAMSQMKDLLRIQIHGDSFFEMAWNLLNKQIYKTHIPSMILSLFCIIILLIIKILKKKYKSNNCIRYIPSALVIVILGTLISYFIRGRYKLKIIGNLETGINDMIFNFFNHASITAFMNLFPSSILISIIAFAESYSMAKDLADKRNYSVEPSQELIAYGIANIVSSFFRGFVTSGSVSRSAIAASCQSQTPLHNIIVTILMLLSLIWLLPLFKWLPKPCLGAIVVMAVINLIDIKAMRHLWKVKKRDFIVCIVTMICTLVLSVENGVAVGVVASLIMYIESASNPSYAVLGRIPQTNTYKNVTKYFTESRDDVLIIRWDNNLFFGNIQVFKKRVIKQIKKFVIDNGIHKHDKWMLLLCCSGINDIDVSAIDQLTLFFEDLRSKYNVKPLNNFDIAISDLKKNTKETLIRAELIQIGQENLDIIRNRIYKDDNYVHVFWDVHHAMYWWDTRHLRQSTNNAINYCDV